MIYSIITITRIGSNGKLNQTAQSPTINFHFFWNFNKNEKQFFFQILKLFSNEIHLKNECIYVYCNSTKGYYKFTFK